VCSDDAIEQDRSLMHLRREVALNLYTFYKLATKSDSPVEWRVFKEIYYIERLLATKTMDFLEQTFSTPDYRAFTLRQFRAMYGFKSDFIGMDKLNENPDFQVSNNEPLVLPRNACCTRTLCVCWRCHPYFVLQVFCMKQIVAHVRRTQLSLEGKVREDEGEEKAAKGKSKGKAANRRLGQPVRANVAGSSGTPSFVSSQVFCFFVLGFGHSEELLHISLSSSI
jgi:hypothetical protein